MKPVGPISVIGLFPPLSRELLALLKSLQPAEWALPLAYPSWTVKDVAAHLLGGNLGRLWFHPNAAASSAHPALGYHELLDLINRDNQAWVEAARRISPEFLTEFLDLTDRRLYAHFLSLPPGELARITVAWAGDELSPNWFDIAREYTEKWLHQQHIREALNRPLLTGRAWLYPVLDTFLRGLPHTYRHRPAADGAMLAVQIVGDSGGDWLLVREKAQWQLYEGQDSRASCRVQLDQDLAWRLFTKGVSPEDARPRICIDGDTALGEPFLAMVSIMA